MTSEEIQCSVVLPVNRTNLFQAWLDSAAHSRFTGSRARIDARAGGIFSTWDGYISGQTLEIDPPGRILQAWRTSEFSEHDPDSLLEVLFEDLDGSTRLVLNHSGLPMGQGESYRQGWEDYYFTPMKEYFSETR